MSNFGSLCIGILIEAMIWPLYAVFQYLSYVKSRRQYFIQLKELGMTEQESQKRTNQLQFLKQPEEPRAYQNIWEALEDDEEEQKRLMALSGAFHALQHEKLLRGDQLVLSAEMNHYISYGIISKATMEDIFEVFRTNQLNTEPLESICKIFNQPIPSWNDFHNQRKDGSQT